MGGIQSVGKVVVNTEATPTGHLGAPVFLSVEAYDWVSSTLCVCGFSV